MFAMCAGPPQEPPESVVAYGTWAHQSTIIEILWRLMMDNSVILITPAHQSHPYEAQSRIRDLSFKGAIDLFGRAVIQRDHNGTPTIKNSDEPHSGSGPSPAACLAASSESSGARRVCSLASAPAPRRVP